MHARHGPKSLIKSEGWDGPGVRATRFTWLGWVGDRCGQECGCSGREESTPQIYVDCELNWNVPTTIQQDIESRQSSRGLAGVGTSSC